MIFILILRCIGHRFICLTKSISFMIKMKSSTNERKKNKIQKPFYKDVHISFNSILTPPMRVPAEQRYHTTIY